MCTAVSGLVRINLIVFIYATHLVFVSVSELKKEFTDKGELVWDKVCVYYKEYDY